MATTRTARRRLLERAGRLAGLLAGLALLAAVSSAWVMRGPFVLRVPRTATLPADAARLEATVRYLAGPCVPRNFRDPGKLELAARHVEESFRASGDSPTSQAYELREGTFRNVIVRRPGSDPSLGMVIVGAHYDAYMSTPGADDNASGVAVLLELARLMRDAPHRRTWIFAAFSTEEPPFFGTDDMGSARLARSLKDASEPVHLMLALDLVGCFSDEPGSQEYPFPGMRLLYPSRGNFIAVTAESGQGRAIATAKRGLLSAGVLPVVSFRGPRSLGYVDLSDHSSFWEAGYPGVLVTNTAMLRNPRYHGRDDLPETLDYPRMALVVQALQGVLAVADGE